MGFDRHRSRTYAQFHFEGTYRRWYSTGAEYTTNYNSYLSCDETCRDRHLNHWREVRKLNRAIEKASEKGLSYEQLVPMRDALVEGNLGGPLQINRCSWDLRDSPTVSIRGWWTPYQQERYDGNLLPDLPGSFPSDDVLPSSDDVLFAKGGTAISRVRPKGADLQGAVAIGELREGLPKVAGSTLWRRGFSPKSTAEEYLNYEFGIKPLIQDINDAVAAFDQADALWAQVERDSGRRIRRRYTFPDEVTSSTVRSTNKLGLYPSLTGSFFSTLGYRYVTTTSTKRTWFSGAFKYALPKRSSAWGRFRRESERWRLCYGMDMSLQTLWNLSPWTWLVDWFVDMQGIMGWLSTASLDGMAMQYGYLMEHKTEERSVYQKGVRLKTTGQLYEPTLTRTRECKKRVQASPFGFGLAWEEFSPRQLAILTALGITRADHLP